MKIEAGDIVHVRGLSNVPGFEDWGDEFEVYEMFGDWYAIEPYEDINSGRILLRGMRLSDFEFYGIRILR